jgi:hypothetical protein
MSIPRIRIGVSAYLYLEVASPEFRREQGAKILEFDVAIRDGLTRHFGCSKVDERRSPSRRTARSSRWGLFSQYEWTVPPPCEADANKPGDPFA